MLRVLLVVAAGGALGAVARWGLGVALPHQPDGFPLATLLVNASGCLLIGVVAELVGDRPLARPFLVTGVLGGYTTFSTYAVDVLGLLQSGRWPVAVGYLVATPVVALVATAAGLRITRAARR